MKKEMKALYRDDRKQEDRWQWRQTALELQMPISEVMFLKRIFDEIIQKREEGVDRTGILEFEEFEAAVDLLLDNKELPKENAKVMKTWNYWDKDTRLGVDFDAFLKWYSSNSFKEDLLLTDEQKQLRRIAKRF